MEVETASATEHSPAANKQLDPPSSTSPGRRWFTVSVVVWTKFFGHFLPDPSPATVLATLTTGPTPPSAVTNVTQPALHPIKLCRSLLRGI